MTGLSKITDKIIAQANNDANKILAEADSECAKIHDDYAKKAEAIKAEINERAEREAASLISRAKSSIAMEQRNVSLSARGDLVDKAFKYAKHELETMTDDKYLDFLTSMLVSVLMKQVEDEKNSRELYGEEDSPEAESYEILLNERDLAKHGAALLENLRRRLVGKNNAGIINKVSLSQTPVNISGGLILRYGNVEINSSISMLFDQMRASLESDVSHILFDNQ